MLTDRRAKRRMFGLLGALAIIAVLVAVEWATGMLGANDASFANNPRDRAALQAEYSDQAWIADIVKAQWSDKKQGLYIESNTDDEATVMAMCDSLIKDVVTRYSGNGIMFIVDQDGNILVSGGGNRCVWRQ